MFAQTSKIFTFLFILNQYSTFYTKTQEELTRLRPTNVCVSRPQHYICMEIY